MDGRRARTIRDTMLDLSPLERDLLADVRSMLVAVAARLEAHPAGEDGDPRLAFERGRLSEACTMARYAISSLLQTAAVEDSEPAVDPATAVADGLALGDDAPEGLAPIEVRRVVHATRVLEELGGRIEEAARETVGGGGDGRELAAAAGAFGGLHAAAHQALFTVENVLSAQRYLGELVAR
jgi:hypothetical protein